MHCKGKEFGIINVSNFLSPSCLLDFSIAETSQIYKTYGRSKKFFLVNAPFPGVAILDSSRDQVPSIDLQAVAASKKMASLKI